MELVTLGNCVTKQLIFEAGELFQWFVVQLVVFKTRNTCHSKEKKSNGIPLVLDPPTPTRKQNQWPTEYWTTPPTIVMAPCPRHSVEPLAQKLRKFSMFLRTLLASDPTSVVSCSFSAAPSRLVENIEQVYHAGKILWRALVCFWASIEY